VHGSTPREALLSDRSVSSPELLSIDRISGKEHALRHRRPPTASEPLTPGTVVDERKSTTR